MGTTRAPISLSLRNWPSMSTKTPVVEGDLSPLPETYRLMNSCPGVLRSGALEVRTGR